MNRRTFSKMAGIGGFGAIAGSGSLAKLLPAAAMAAPDGPALSRSRSNAGEQTSGRGTWDHYFLGTAYYPEWWEPAEWETDFRRMRELGLNTVRMGEFAWSRFEPAAGQFDFDWMDRAIAAANRNGVDVVLGTPTASAPPWLYQLHPDVLGANEKGPYSYGGRKGYCTNSANYLEACTRVTAALGKHYGHHPGVIGWQLDNEPGEPFVCYDANCERAFRVWLQKKYGTLEALNRSWNGAFWSNEYSGWAQIHFPVNSASGGWQPAITLDYRRFFSDSYLNHLRRQAAILRQGTANQFIMTNWPCVTWSVDIFAGAEFLDAAVWDNYVSAPGLSDFHNQYFAGFNHDLCRCAGPRQRFFCAEQNAYVPANALDQGLRLQAYVDLAHGSHGQLFFEWRRPLGGAEQFRPSFIKRFDGEINPAKPVFAQLGKELAGLGPRLAGATTRADLALVYDYGNEFAQGFRDQGDKDRHYDSEAVRFYRGFKVLQRNIDVVPLAIDFSAYKVVVAPSLRLVDDATVERLRKYVDGGGILVLNYRAGTQNPNGSMRRAIPPGAFAEMVGVIAESNLDLVEYGPGMLAEKQRAELGVMFSGSETVFAPRTTLERLTLRGAEPVATYRGGRMAGLPAITRNRHGRGWVYYAGVDSAQDEFHECLARAVAATGKLAPLIPAPYGVEVVSREDAEAVYYFLLNLTETGHSNIELPGTMENLISGEKGVTRVSLAPLEVAVMASPR